MKHSRMRIGLALAVLFLVAGRASAIDTLPDGGATSLLLVVSVAGMALARKLLR